MASRPPAPWVRAVIYCNADQKEFSNDFWFYPGDDFAIQLDTVKTDTHDLVLALSTNMKNILSENITIRGGYVEWADVQRVIGFESYNAVPGFQETFAMPEDVAAVVQKISLGPGKSGRGRWYFSGIAENMCGGSYLTAFGVTTMNTFVTFLQANITIGTNTLTPNHFSPLQGAMYTLDAVERVDLLGTRRRRRGPF